MMQYWRRPSSFGYGEIYWHSLTCWYKHKLVEPFYQTVLWQAKNLNIPNIWSFLGIQPKERIKHIEKTLCSMAFRTIQMKSNHVKYLTMRKQWNKWTNYTYYPAMETLFIQEYKKLGKYSCCIFKLKKKARI